MSSALINLDIPQFTIVPFEADVNRVARNPVLTREPADLRHECDYTN
jgi:hypothetical protein